MGVCEVTYERRNAGIIESTYMKLRRDSIYIALEETNFIWNMAEVVEFDQLWNEGRSLAYMAKYFDRSIDEVALLVMDRSIKKQIKPRKQGIMGKE